MFFTLQTGSDYVPEEGELSELTILRNETEEDPQPRPGPSAPQAHQNFRRRQRGEIPLWRQLSGSDTALEIPEWLGYIEPSVSVKCPVDCFKTFFSDDLLDVIVEESNLYSVQKHPDKRLALSKNELEQFLGTLFAMSLVKLSNSRMYWKGKLHCPMITEVMTRDRWEEIKANIHFQDNTKDFPKTDPNHDVLFKVRPLLTHLSAKFREIPMTQRLCIDEQMVPFKGVSSIKQYLPGKSHKWGYKIHCLCGSDGIMYNFSIYTGKIQPVVGEPDLGASSNVVLQLAQCIPEGKNYLLYF